MSGSNGGSHWLRSVKRSVTALSAATALLVGSLAFAPASQAEPLWTPRGIPLAGQVLVGAAIANGVQDPVAREAQLGAPLAVHRTYWRGDQQTKALDRAAQDLAAGRVPWVSFKAPLDPSTGAPFSWAQMAAGAGDAWAADLAGRLGGLGGPVWVAIHHNPERRRGVANVQDWKAMQQRLAPVFRAQPNIAFTVILTGYYQFAVNDPALSMAALWPGVQHVDVTGFATYNRYGTISGATGKPIRTFTELSTYYTKIKAWAASVGGAKWAVAETAYTDAAAALDANWLFRAYDDLKVAGGSALVYWDGASRPADDSDEDPNATYSLDLPVKLSIFAQLLGRSGRYSPASQTPPTPVVTPPVTTPPAAPPGAPASPTTVPPRPVVKVKVLPGSSKFRVDVDPNKGRGYWRMKVQRQRADGSWSTYKKTYRTVGSKERRTFNFKKGAYRVVVLPKYGYESAVSLSVRLKR
jgi:hypothetical protein